VYATAEPRANTTVKQAIRKRGEAIGGSGRV
jgi:hypothetical protein